MKSFAQLKKNDKHIYGDQFTKDLVHRFLGVETDELLFDEQESIEDNTQNEIDSLRWKPFSGDILLNVSKNNNSVPPSLTPTPTSSDENTDGNESDEEDNADKPEVSKEAQENINIAVPDKNSVARKLERRWEDLSDQINGEIRNTSADLNLDLFKIEFFKLRAGLKVRPYNQNDIHHDAAKISNNEFFQNGDVYNWNDFLFFTEAQIPFSLSMPAGPVALSFSAVARAKVQYQMITRGKTLYEKEDNWWKQFKIRLGENFRSLKLIRIPLRPEKFIEKYDPGTEVRMTGNSSLVMSAGVSYGLQGIASVGGSLVTVLTGDFEKHVKIVSVGQNYPVLRVRIKNSTSRSHDARIAASMSMNLFNIKFNTPIPFLEEISAAGNLSVSLLSASIATSKSKSFYYDFSFDLNYPEARSAYTEMIKGNLIPAERLSITRNQVADYRGVILNQSKLDKIHKRIVNFGAGFMANNSQLVNSISNFKLDEKFGNFLHLYRRDIYEDRDSDKNGFYEELSKLKEYKYYYDDKLKALLGYISDNYRTVRMNAAVVKTKHINEEGEISDKPIMKLTYSYNEKKRYSNKSSYHKFLSYAMRSLAWKDPRLYRFISEVYHYKKCNNDLSISYNGTFYQKALLAISELPEDDIWKSLARFVGLDVSTAQLGTLRNDAELRLSPEEEKKLSKQQKRFARKIIRKFKNKGFMRQMRKVKKANSLEQKAKYFKVLFSKYKGDPFVLHFFASLVHEIFHGEEDMGMALKLSLQSQKCQLNWKFQKIPSFRPEDIISDWVNN